MVDGRRKNGSKEGLARARAVLQDYIRRGKTVQEDQSDSDDDAVFTLEDFKELEPQPQPEPEPEPESEPVEVKPVEPTKPIDIPVPTPKVEVKETHDPYKEKYDTLEKEFKSLREQLTKPVEPPKPIIKIVEKTRKQLMEEQLRARLFASFN